MLDCIKQPYYTSSSLAQLRGISGDDPEGGARRGVPRRRLITVVSGGTGPRPPGTTTWLRGARWTDPEQMPEKEARDRSPKSPRWSAGRRASPVWDARRLARRLACRVTCRPNGCLASTRTSLGAPPPLIGASEAKVSKPGRRKRAAGPESITTGRVYGFRARGRSLCPDSPKR